jgi:phosphate transport system substrate-binding protein
MNSFSLPKLKSMVIALGLLFVSISTACSEITANLQSPTSIPLKGRITFAGSTTLQPLAGRLGDVFRERYPEVVLEIAAGGSVVGIEAIHEGTVDIGMASRALKVAEAEGIERHQIAIDVLAVIVNPANPVEGLTTKQLQAIYTGEITNWQEVGGSDQPIVVVTRGKNSGTRGAFDEIILEKQEPTAPSLRTAITAGDMAAIVANDLPAIGYVGFGNLEPGTKTLTIDNVTPSKETARDGSYKLVRPLLFLTGPLTQPIASTYINFALSPEGQQLVEEDGWVPVR